MSRTWKDTKAWYEHMSDILQAVCFTWDGPAWARFCKRQLSKSRRQAWRHPPRYPKVTRWESECDWKGH